MRCGNSATFRSFLNRGSRGEPPLLCISRASTDSPGNGLSCGELTNGLAQPLWGKPGLFGAIDVRTGVAGTPGVEG